MKPNSDGVVYLDEFAVSDASSLHEADYDPEHRKRFEFPTDFVPSIEHSENLIRGWKTDMELGKRYSFAVRESESGRFVGGCEIRPKDNASVANLSYWTHPDYRRRGYATRAVAIARIIAAKLGITRLEIVVDYDNVASQCVATNNGFSQSADSGGRNCFICNPCERHYE